MSPLAHHMFLICTLYMGFFLLADVWNQSFLLFSGNRCTFVFICRLNWYRLCLVFPMLFIFGCCVFPWKPQRPHVHYYWPRSIQTKLLSESSLVVASSVYLRSRHWKWECLYKSHQLLYTLYDWKPNIIRFFLDGGVKLDTTDMSHHCFNDVLEDYLFF